MNLTAITKPLLAVAVNYDKLRFPVIISPKLDGIRCLKINGRALSRKFKPIPNDYIRNWIEANCSDGFDGELLCLDPTAPMKEVSSMVMSKSHPAEKSFVYAVFDWVPGDRLDTPFRTRIVNVETWFETVRKDKPEITRHMRPVPHGLIRTRAELDAAHINWVGVGYEGTMLRDPEGPYKCGRSTVNQGILLKLKDWADEEAHVIGVVEQMENTNEATRDEVGSIKRSTAKEGKVGKGTLGALICRTVTDDVEFNLGTGWTDDERQEMWDAVSVQGEDDFAPGTMSHDVIGAVVKFKHQPDPGKGRAKGVAPRFPIALGFRNVVID